MRPPGAYAHLPDGLLHARHRSARKRAGVVLRQLEYRCVVALLGAEKQGTEESVLRVEAVGAQQRRSAVVHGLRKRLVRIDQARAKIEVAHGADHGRHGLWQHIAHAGAVAQVAEAPLARRLATAVLQVARRAEAQLEHRRRAESDVDGPLGVDSADGHGAVSDAVHIEVARIAGPHAARAGGRPFLRQQLGRQRVVRAACDGVAALEHLAELGGAGHGVEIGRVRLDVVDLPQRVDQDRRDKARRAEHELLLGARADRAFEAPARLEEGRHDGRVEHLDTITQRQAHRLEVGGDGVNVAAEQGLVLGRVLGARCADARHHKAAGPSCREVVQHTACIDQRDRAPGRLDGASYARAAEQLAPILADALDQLREVSARGRVRRPGAEALGGEVMRLRRTAGQCDGHLERDDLAAGDAHGPASLSARSMSEALAPSAIFSSAATMR
ncbi:MAG: hypothetical protein CAPSK01_004572 [Candidatus Accumulibacter vicinus]|uniref:Uncharacterized protein n=1 Tax=Candidatus Accumulibacter vicinus TaxID=2954382 RepID=A0A084XUQ9_9PROT|nr:MAG: hypothetical protein CAPSK01_004572 [Candidatus Accumulibacter vicinus]